MNHRCLLPLCLFLAGMVLITGARWATLGGLPTRPPCPECALTRDAG